MATRKKMMLPVSLNDLPAVQGWLQGLAAQGWLLEGCRGSMFYFIKKEAAQRRYRVDPSKGTSLGWVPPKLMDMYQEFGWHYVDSCDRYHHVFYTEDPEAVEPFVSPEALAEMLERLKQKRLLFYIPCIAIYLVCMVYLWTLPTRPLLRKTTDLALLILLCVGVYDEIKPLLTIKEQASDGTLLNSYYPHQMDRTTFWRHTIGNVAIILTLISLFFL